MRRTLKIGTWNLQCALGANKNARRKSAILDIGADIWILTETHDDIDLRSNFEAAHADPADISVAPKELRAGSRWTTIWTRFPVLSVLPVSDPQRSASALLNTPFGLLVVYGTVLPWPGSKPSFRDAVSAQGADWVALRQAHPDAALCIAGDLNADMIDGKSFPGKVGIRALRDAMEVCNLHCVTLPAPGAAARIDHILLPEIWSGKTEIVATLAGADPDGHKLSDHDGVVVEINL